ncbi:MAG: hypothetical protein IT379_06430 [Deltaproteobacteria bacterium]|nr:hypothetical protein [Deltaproteobacteria bacterium]
MRRNRTESTSTNTTPNARSVLEAAEQVEATFRDFVHNALRDTEAPTQPSANLGRPPRPGREGSSPGAAARTRPSVPPSSAAKILPLLRKKKAPERGSRRDVTARVEQPPELGATAKPEAPRPATRRKGTDATPIPSAVPRASRPPPLPTRSEATVKRHAAEVAELVPDVAKVAPKPGPREAAEDGQIPALELDRFLAEMATLLKYGHDAQVQLELDTIRHRYPRDLLLLRRLAELHLERRDHDRAIDVLFQLASGMFDRKNVEGMRATLDEVLKLDPGNRRAMRLLGLLKQR